MAIPLKSVENEIVRTFVSSVNLVGEIKICNCPFNDRIVMRQFTDYISDPETFYSHFKFYVIPVITFKVSPPLFNSVGPKGAEPPVPVLEIYIRN